MYFSTLLLGVLLNTRVFALKPSLHSLRALFIGSLDRLLRVKPQGLRTRTS